MELQDREANHTKSAGLKAIIYIINLDRSVDRRAAMEKELLKTNIPFQFISAVDAASVNSINHKVNCQYKRPIIDAEIACFLSHIKVKKHFLQTNNDFAIILEDDAQLLEDFDAIVKKAMNQFPMLPKKNQWDVLKLAPYGRKKLIKVKEIDSTYSLYGGTVAITTMAAIWSREGVKKFLKNTIKNDFVIITMPIDCTLQLPLKYDLKIYNIAPEVVRELHLQSQIRTTKRLKSNTFSRIRYELLKLFPNLYLYCRTWLFR